MSGPPASGKTSLARDLAPKLNLPLIAKDDIKESLSDTLGLTDLEWSRKLGAAAFDLLFILMQRFVADGASAMFEANFYPERHRDAILDLPAMTFEVHCSADHPILERRNTERERHPVHHLLPIPEGSNGPLDLEHCVQVDTGAGEPVDLEHIAQLIKEAAHGL